MSRYWWLLSGILLLLPSTVLAQQKGFLDSLGCIKSGHCSLDDIATGFIILSKWLLGVMGALALFYFVWGGIWWLTSAGNQEKVKRGRDAMIGTTMALFVAFGSYVILDLWINRILNADTQFQVKSECQGKDGGQRCGVGNYYVCAGVFPADDYRASLSEQCISKCQQLNVDEEEEGFAWICLDESRIDPAVPPDRKLSGYCPEGTGYYCVSDLFRR